MEDINPLLHFVLQLRLSLERGEALRLGLRTYLQSFNTELTPDLSEWFLAQEQHRSIPLGKFLRSPHRQSVMGVLQRGLKGEPILQTLQVLESEILQACIEDLEQKAALLPIKCLVPLLFLQFPALIMLLLGPLLQEMQSAF